MLALGTAACGGTTHAHVARAASSHAADPTTTTAAEAGNGAASGSSPSPAVAPNRQTGSPAAAPSPQQGGGAAAPSGGATSTTVATLPLQAAFAATCVRPGTAQTITVTSKPNAGIAYNSVYADGNNARDNRTDYYGGNKGGRTDAQGIWRDTWTVSPKAPPGPVHVDVVGIAAGAGAGSITTGFAVARLDGTCP
jgi:hypothetical protein